MNTDSKSWTLVTGGAGFIGSHLARHLLQEGYGVVVLDDLSGGFQQNVPQGAEFVNGSVLNEPLLEQLFTRFRFEYVYHLAAYAAEGLSHFIRNFNYTNNVLGSINIVNSSIRHKVRRLVYTSSIAVYGKNQLPMREDLTPAPEDPYGVAKYAVELDLAAAHGMFGLKYTVFRPHNVFGENQNIGDAYRNVIGIFMNQLFKGQDLTVFGEGNQTRAFTYVSDVVIPMVQCLSLPQTALQVFNVGSDKYYTIEQLAHLVMDAIGIRVDLRHVDARKEVIHAFADHTKLQAYFKNLPPCIPIEEGLRRMAAWAKVRGPQSTPRFTCIEIEENLPSVWRSL